MDVISLLNQLESKFNCHHTSLPVRSMDHIIAFRKDVFILFGYSNTQIAPSESLSTSDLLFRLRDVFREIDVINESQKLSGEQIFHMLVETSDSISL